MPQTKAYGASVANGKDVALGAIADAAYVSGSGTVVSILKGIFGKLSAALGVKAAGLKYVTVAASTTQALGTGAVGDTLNSLVIIPGTAAAGIVQIKDGGGSAITVFAGGGTTALPSLAPIPVTINAVSAAGAWSVITNANVTAIAVGQFTP